MIFHKFPPLPECGHSIDIQIELHVEKFDFPLFDRDPRRSTTTRAPLRLSIYLSIYFFAKNNSTSTRSTMCKPTTTTSATTAKQLIRQFMCWLFTKFVHFLNRKNHNSITKKPKSKRKK